MIYLFGNINSGNLKIGYTGDMKRRERQYKTHNPDGKFLCVRDDGDRVLERKLHLLAKFKGLGVEIDGKLSKEWFKGTDELISLFSWPCEKIDKELYDHAEYIFCKPEPPFVPPQNSLDGRIYKSLIELFSKNNNPQP